MAEQNHRDDLLTPAEVAALFRVNPKTVTRWARAGKITAIRTLGRPRRFRASEIKQELVDALDHWALWEPDEAIRLRLAAVARAADPDPWRDRFRDPAVWADPGLLERALANLVANALVWSPPHEPVRVRATAHGGHVAILIADRGPGIPRDQLARVFEPFQRLGDRSSQAGVGLGLAVAREIVFLGRLGSRFDAVSTKRDVDLAGGVFGASPRNEVLMALRKHGHNGRRSAALVGKAATAQIDPPLAAIVFVSALVASPIGAAVSVRTQPRALLAILAVIVMFAALRIAFTAVTGT